MHKPIKRLPSDVPSGRRRVKGKQPEKGKLKEVEATVSMPVEQDDLTCQGQETDGSDEGAGNSDSTSSSSSSSSTASSSSSGNNIASQPAEEQHTDADNENKSDKQHPQKQSSSPQAADAQDQSKPEDQHPLKQSSSSSSSSRNQQGLSDIWMI